jgi:hypothetical protein
MAPGIYTVATFKLATLLREPTNTGFVARWNRIKQSKEVQLIGRLHSDICNVVTYLLPCVKLQIKLTKNKRPFYLMSTKADPTTKFQFLEAYLIVNRIRPNPYYLIGHNTTLAKGGLARYNRWRVELKTSTFQPDRNPCPMTTPSSDSCRNV